MINRRSSEGNPTMTIPAYRTHCTSCDKRLTKAEKQLYIHHCGNCAPANSKKEN